MSSKPQQAKAEGKDKTMAISEMPRFIRCTLTSGNQDVYVHIDRVLQFSLAMVGTKKMATLTISAPSALNSLGTVTATTPLSRMLPFIPTDQEDGF